MCFAVGGGSLSVKAVIKIQQKEGSQTRLNRDSNTLKGDKD